MITARVLSLEQLEEIAGAECLAAMLSEFSCPLNKRVEEFIRRMQFNPNGWARQLPILHSRPRMRSLASLRLS